MLNELETGIASISSGGFGGADLIYGGDTEQWKRFGNSLMLRLAMRMSEVDAASARTWVGKAIAGGVMQSNADDAFIAHTNGPEGVNRNGIGEVLDKSNGFGDDCPRLSATLVDWMTATGDPRLDIFGELPASGSGVHNGMPNGLDDTSIQDNPTGTSVDDFDRVNPVLVTVESPMMFMTYAETELLLAEAAVKGWHTGDAATHYENGVRAGMKQYAHWDASLEVADADIDAYLAANAFDGSESQIGWQYWAATFLNEYESFANWRRTGYPELTPTNHPNNVTGGTIPLRLVYPQGEAGGNPDNFQAALDRQGMSSDFTSHLTVPVWWDK